MPRSVTLVSLVHSNFPSAFITRQAHANHEPIVLYSIENISSKFSFSKPIESLQTCFSIVSLRHQCTSMRFVFADTVCFCRYGDKTPKSFISRLFSVIWIMTGITICSLLTATLSSAFTNEQVDYYGVLYGKKV